MKKLKSRDEWLNEGHSYDNEIEKARMMQGSASDLVEWAARKIAESKPENFKEGIISPIQEAKDKTWMTSVSIKDALKKGRVNVGSMVDVDTSSNNKELPKGQYAIMPFTDDGDYWNARDLKKFADKVIDDLNKNYKGNVELIKIDTGKSIRSYIVSIDESVNEAKESYKIMRLVNGRTKELIEGTIGEIMDQFSRAIDKLRDSGSGKQYKDDPKTIEELVKYLNAAQSYIDKGKSKITYEIQESVNERFNSQELDAAHVVRGGVEEYLGDYENVETYRKFEKMSRAKDSAGKKRIIADVLMNVEDSYYGSMKLSKAMRILKTKKEELTTYIADSLGQAFESVDEAAKDHRFKYVISKDYKNHGVVDFVKGDQFYVEIDADGNTVPYSYKDVWILDKEDTDKLQKAMMKGTLKPDSSPKELKAFIDKHIGKQNESVNERRKPITKKHWDKADDDQKEEWLLQAYSDPDDAMEYVEMDWNDLPDTATSNMYEALNFIIRPAKSGDPFAPYGKPFFITTKDADLVVKKMNDLGIRTFTNKDGGEFEVGLETYDPKAFGYPGKSGKLIGINQDVLQKALDTLDQRKDKITGFGWMSTNESVNEDDNWSDDVKTKWTPPAGLFTEPANKIADVLHKESDDLDQAMSRLQFYINRGGKLIDDKAKANLETAKKLLQQKYA